MQSNKSGLATRRLTQGPEPEIVTISQPSPLVAVYAIPAFKRQWARFMAHWPPKPGEYVTITEDPAE